MLSSWSGPLQTLNQVIETLPLLVWRARKDGGWLWASPQWEAFTGQTQAESVDDGWLAAVHPDDRDAARTAWRLAPDQRSFEVEFRVLKAQEQQYLWHKTRAAPVLDESGAILEWLGTSTDIDALRRLRDQESALLAALQHRVRNMLGVVRALARRTADDCESMEDFVLKFDGRLNAFARTQSLSAQSPTGQVNLREIVGDELLLHRLNDEQRITMAGPDVMLGTKAANLLGLAVHELASHAVTQHSPNDPPFDLKISWRLEHGAGAARLHFNWTEKGMMPGEAGSSTLDRLARDILESALEYEFDARSRIEVGTTGLVLDLDMPLARVQENDG